MAEIMPIIPSVIKTSAKVKAFDLIIIVPLLIIIVNIIFIIISFVTYANIIEYCLWKMILDIF